MEPLCAATKKKDRGAADMRRNTALRLALILLAVTSYSNALRVSPAAAQTASGATLKVGGAV